MNRYFGVTFVAAMSSVATLGCGNDDEARESTQVPAEYSPPAHVPLSGSPLSAPTTLQRDQAFAPEVARLVGRIYLHANPLADHSALRETVRQNRAVFAKDSTVIRCAEALGSRLYRQAVMSFAQSDYDRAHGQALEMGANAEQARAVADSLQSNSLDTYMMAKELLWLAQVLPVAADGDWGPFETTGTPARQQIRQVLPILQWMLDQDPAMKAVLDQTLIQYAPIVEEQIVWLAVMTGVCKSG